MNITFSKENSISIIFWIVFLFSVLFLIIFSYYGHLIDFTAREFCILKGREQNKTADDVVDYDSNCFHPLDRETPINQCRIKCTFSD